jgi:hypothetical protein
MFYNDRLTAAEAVIALPARLLDHRQHHPHHHPVRTPKGHQPVTVVVVYRDHQASMIH